MINAQLEAAVQVLEMSRDGWVTVQVLPRTRRVHWTTLYSTTKEGTQMIQDIKDKADRNGSATFEV